MPKVKTCPSRKWRLEGGSEITSGLSIPWAPPSLSAWGQTKGSSRRVERKRSVSVPVREPEFISAHHHHPEISPQPRLTFEDLIPYLRGQAPPLRWGKTPSMNMFMHHQSFLFNPYLLYRNTFKSRDRLHIRCYSVSFRIIKILWKGDFLKMVHTIPLPQPTVMYFTFPVQDTWIISKFLPTCNEYPHINIFMTSLIISFGEISQGKTTRWKIQSSLNLFDTHCETVPLLGLSTSYHPSFRSLYPYWQWAIFSQVAFLK